MNSCRPFGPTGIIAVTVIAAHFYRDLTTIRSLEIRDPDALSSAMKFTFLNERF